VPFTLVHAGKYKTEDKLKIQIIQKTKHSPEKAKNAKHSKTKLPWFSCFLRLSARKQGGLILQDYNAPEPIWGTSRVSERMS